MLICVVNGCWVLLGGVWHCGWLVVGCWVVSLCSVLVHGVLFGVDGCVGRLVGVRIGCVIGCLCVCGCIVDRLCVVVWLVVVGVVLLGCWLAMVC